MTGSALGHSFSRLRNLSRLVWNLYSLLGVLKLMAGGDMSSSCFLFLFLGDSLLNFKEFTVGYHWFLWCSCLWGQIL